MPRFLLRSLPALLILLALTGCYAIGQPEPDQAFETRLFEFRHSLYPMMVNVKSFDLLAGNALAGQLSQRITRFISDNRVELRKYREDRLRKQGRFKVDLTDFVEVPLSPDLARDILNGQQEKLKPLLVLMDPLAQIYNYVPLTLMHEGMSSSDMSLFYMHASIGVPMFQARPGSGDEWVVLADYYTRAFRFIYHADTGVTELKSYYHRKPGH